MKSDPNLTEIVTFFLEVNFTQTRHFCVNLLKYCWDRIEWDIFTRQDSQESCYNQNQNKGKVTFDSRVLERVHKILISEVWKSKNKIQKGQKSYLENSADISTKSTQISLDIESKHSGGDVNARTTLCRSSQLRHELRVRVHMQEIHR